MLIDSIVLLTKLDCFFGGKFQVFYFFWFFHPRFKRSFLVAHLQWSRFNLLANGHANDRPPVERLECVKKNKIKFNERKPE